LSKNVHTIVNENKYKTLGLGLILLIVPLIVFMKAIKLEGVTYEFWTGQKSYADFFSYYKSVWLMILTGLSLLVFFYCLYKKQIDLKALTSKTDYKLLFLIIPLICYYLFVFLSASFSNYKEQAIWGFTDRREGFFVISCYVLLCLIATFTVNTKLDLKIVFTLLFISAAIISILGITQFFGFDFFQTIFGKKMILPRESQSMAGSLKFNFPKNFIYGTLYNPNYVGSYFSMLFPISLGFMITAKKWSFKSLSFIMAFLSFLNLVGSLSLTGYIAAGLSTIIMFILLRKDIIKSWKSIVLLIACCIPLIILMNNVSGQAIFRGSGSIGVKPNTPPTTVQASTNPAVITDFDIKGNLFKIYVNNNELNVKFDKASNQCIFSDKSGNVIDITPSPSEAGKYTLNNSAFKGLSIKIDKSYFQFIGSNATVPVSIIQDQGFKYVTYFGKMVDQIYPESYGFKGRERFGSSRGYIWSRSLPLIKDTLILGHGPDTYAIYFPQNDFSNKLKYLDNNFILVDKPHNMYIQYAINTGVLSLIAFLILVAFYFISSFIIYFKGKEHNEFFITGVGCLTAVTGFLISAIANDSVVSVSPVFWILLGVGIACNRVYKSTNTLNTKTVK
jgi:O-antigen ligase